MKKATSAPLLIAVLIFTVFLFGFLVGRLSPGNGVHLSDIPSPSVPTESVGAASGAYIDGKMNINTAGVEDLSLLPGIGSILAQRIIDYRTKHGPFTDIQQLQNVHGIGAATFEKIAQYLTVG